MHVCVIMCNACVHRSVKHYFLLDQGDFIVQFMDMAEDEMKKPMEGSSSSIRLLKTLSNATYTKQDRRIELKYNAIQ